MKAKYFKILNLLVAITLFAAYLGQSLHFIFEYHGSIDCDASGNEKHLHNNPTDHHDCFYLFFNLRSHAPDNGWNIHLTKADFYNLTSYSSDSLFSKIEKTHIAERAPPAYL